MQRAKLCEIKRGETNYNPAKRYILDAFRRYHDLPDPHVG